MTSHQKPWGNSRLWLSLRLNKLPAEALNIHDEDTPMVVTEMQRVIFCNKAATAAGVVADMNITTAQLLSNCACHLRNRTAENTLLRELCAQLYQFTPHIQIYECQHKPYSGLLLELSSCLLLFSGTKKLIDTIFIYLTEKSHAFDYGIAHTAPAAWLLSFSQQTIAEHLNKDNILEQLKQLPIHLLHEFPTEIAMLQKSGFTHIGDITQQINAHKVGGLKKRFGEKFTEYLCDLFEIEQTLQQSSLFTKPLPSYQPLEFFCESIQLDYPVTQNDQLYYPAENLLQNLSDYLRKHQLECQHIEWVLSDIYRNTCSIHVHSDTPESHWQLLYDLTLIQLDNRDLPFEVDSLTLSCRNTQAIHNRNQLLAFDPLRKSPLAARSFAITIAKLKARLGEAAIHKLSYQDALLPEATNAKITLNQTANQDLPHIHKKSLRPTWLLPSPQFIEERKQGLYWRGNLMLLAGPERINANWWDKPVARDYFVAQRHDYVRLWIFFDLHQKRWYVHGIFA